MSLIKTLTPTSLMQEFKDANRDNFSYGACCELIEWYNNDPVTELDIIALCCEWTEDHWKSISDDYALNAKDREECLLIFEGQTNAFPSVFPNILYRNV